MKGFTLIELLVVITIIAILSTMGFIAYNSFTKHARDAKRLSDLKIIQSALEDYNADKSSYPSSLDVLTVGSTPYLKQVPNDPTGGMSYSYLAFPTNCTGSACTSYCLYAKMEGDNPPPSDSWCKPQPSPYNYGVTRP